MIVYPGKFIFLAQPHTASSAIRSALLDAFKPEAGVPDHLARWRGLEGPAKKPRLGWNHYGLTDFYNEEAFDSLWNGDEVAWAVQRNPYDLAVTWFLRKEEFRGGDRYAGLPFAEFLRVFDTEPFIVEGRCLWHEADEWIDYENLNTEINELLTEVKLPPISILRTNKTQGKEPWRTYYDDEAIDVMNSRFGNEIEEFGYDLLGAGG